MNYNSILEEVRFAPQLPLTRHFKLTVVAKLTVPEAGVALALCVAGRAGETINHIDA